MKKYNLVVFCLMPLLIGAATYIGVRVWNMDAPRLEIDQTIWLGLQIPGNVVQVPLTIGNSGRSALRIRNFRTNCACVTVNVPSKEKSPSGAPPEIVIPPGEQLKAIVRVTVPGGTTGEQRWLMNFDTNDPRQPSVQVAICATADGVVRAVPPMLHLGTMARGQKLARTIKIHDTGRAVKCRIVRAVSSQPEFVKIGALHTLYPKMTHQKSIFGAPVASMDVVIRAPMAPSSINAEIAIYEEGRKDTLLKIPVRGVVRPAVTITPAVVVLPRAAENGPLYEVECHFRSANGNPLDLTVQSVPPGIRVTICESAHSKDNRKVRIEWLAQSRMELVKEQTDTVSIHAKAAGLDEIVTLPVIRRPRQLDQ